MAIIVPHVPPKVSPVTGKPTPEYYIHADTAHFRDAAGRTVLLRGVNLSGTTKAPVGQQSHLLDGFWEDADGVEGQFIGAPLNIDDGTADVHLARLRGWGFNMLRYIFTWETLEHEGPGKYDFKYMDYIVKVLRKCKEYGFKVFMDPHQDIWSRFSGGSGAPLWTLYACGFNPRNFTVTNAAFLHAEYPSPAAPKPGSFPAMIWSTNYTHLVSQTMFTLFYGGRDFAPLCVIDGKNIQDYLQDHYFGAVTELAKKIAEAGDLLDECVLGWDSLNEPGDGMIGHPELSTIPASQANKNGPTPTAFQGMMLGMGERVEVENWQIGSLGPSRNGNVVVDPKGAKAWLEEDAEKDGSRYGWRRGLGWKLGKCIWAMHGVWDTNTNTLLKPRYFATNPGNDSKVEFVADYWRPHWLAYAEIVRAQHPEAIHFIQPPVFHQPPPLPESHLMGRACLAPHYYDGLTLITKHWNWFNADALGLLRGKYTTVLQAVKVGEPAIRRSFQDQLGMLKDDCLTVVGEYPSLIGEIGIPYDMDGKKAYGYVDGGKGVRDFSAQQKALDASLNAADGPNMLNWTMWTYCADNSHQWGDGWNGEDLSIWSEEDTERAATECASPNGSAVVLGQNGQTTSQISSASSNRSSNATVTSQLVDRVSPAVINAGHSIPPELLYDGSRALGAFCRPYPFATVGVPSRVDFDIKTTTFKMSVVVSPETFASDTVMTEIFLPFVHYASDSSPLRSLGAFEDASVTSITPLNAEKPSSPITPKATGQPSASRMELDVDVKVTHGRYEIHGQVLKWWYPIPELPAATATSSSDGLRDEFGTPIAERTYSIEVKRRGGAIPRIADSSTTWWDICSPDSCVIC